MLSIRVHGQESEEIYSTGKRYIDFKLDKLSSYNKRLSAKQDRLINNLRKKEARLLKRLRGKDSTSHALLSGQPVSFDSISRLQRPDSETLAKKNRSGHKAIDSLKSVHSFIHTQSDKLGISYPDDNTTMEITNLQQELNYRKYKDELITQRANSLKSASTKNKLSGFTSLEKKVFYAKQQMKALKDISEEPTKAEEKALEYLQGTEGFDQHMDQMNIGLNSTRGVSSNATSSDLEKMGFQTKKQLEGSLKEKFGNNLNGVTQKMGGQVKEFQDKLSDVKGKVKEGKKSVSDTKSAASTARNIEKPSFKVNPERGKLFWQRIEKQYNWQTSRATVDNPAMLEASAMAGFKHTPRLTYGLGIATNIGLGQGWDKVKISFEGIGLRSFVSWEWQYGIGAYAGYERMYKKVVFTNTLTPGSETITSSVHSTDEYSESVLVGLTKSYHINDRYNGAIQLLYDIWWREKGLRSPIVLRFSTKTR
jgi:hypothetical protein